MRIESSAFEDGREIPRTYTCDGKNISPPLKWVDVPEGTKELVLICEDIDAPIGTITHWVLHGIDPELGELEEGVKPDSVPGNGIHGRRSFGKKAYMGPCPPGSKSHRYVFNMYALDVRLDLDVGVKRKNLEKRMKGHVIDSAKIVGTYKRQK